MATALLLARRGSSGAARGGLGYSRPHKGFRVSRIPPPQRCWASGNAFARGHAAPPVLEADDEAPRHLVPAGLMSRGVATLLDGVVSLGVASAAAEYAIVHYGSGLEVFVASFGGMMLLRDQLPGKYPSLGKNRMGLELVVADRSQRGEQEVGRFTDKVVIHAGTVAATDVTLGRGNRLLRNAHWGLLVPLSLSELLPIYYTLPCVVCGALLIEAGLILTIRRSIGDLLGGSQLVWHDVYTSNKKQEQVAEAEGGGTRIMRAQEAWDAKLAKRAKSQASAAIAVEA